MGQFERARGRRFFRWRRIAAVVAVVAATGLGGCEIGVLHPQGPVGAAQKAITLNALFVMLAVVVPTLATTIGFVWWFRASNVRAFHRPDWSYSGRIELVTWSIPLLAVLFLGGIAWVGSHELDPARPLSSDEKPLEVEVVSLDWKWLFILPEQGVAAVNELAVPVGRPLSFRLTSASVMNAFFVPQLGSMIYTMNGMATRLHLQADREGDYEGLSAHFSGDGFSGMRFSLRAMAPRAFDSWAMKAASGDMALDKAAYEQLAQPSSNVVASTYRLADRDLFTSIVKQEIAPAPGPAGTIEGSKASSAVLGPICTPASPLGQNATGPITRPPRG